MQPLKPSVKGERRYPCGFPGCKWVFTRSNHVLRHHQRVHPGYAKQNAAAAAAGNGLTAATSIPSTTTAVRNNSNNNNNNNGNLFPSDLSSVSAVAAAGVIASNRMMHKSLPKQSSLLTSSPFTQSEADRFRELMSRSLIKCDVPSCDQTFKSASALARHKSMIHAIADDADEEEGEEEGENGLHIDHGSYEDHGMEEEDEDDHDLEDEISAQQISHSSLLLPSLMTSMTSAAIAGQQRSLSKEGKTANMLATAVTPDVLKSLRLLERAAGRPEERKKLNAVQPNHNQIITTASDLHHQSLLGNACKPFICSIDDCPKSFTRRDHLKRHQVQSHHQHVLQQTVLEHMMKQQQLLLQQPVTTSLSSEVILEEDNQGDEWTATTTTTASNGLQDGSESQDGEPPIKRMKKITIRKSPAGGSAQIVLEDESPDLTTTTSSSLTYLQQQHQTSQENMMRLVSMAVMANKKNGKNGTSSVVRSEENTDVHEDADGVKEEQDHEENQDDNGQTLLLKQEDDDPTSSADPLPPISMEPEVVLEVDEDIVWQPTTSINSNNGNGSHNSSNNRTIATSSSARPSLHPAMAMVTDVTRNQKKQQQQRHQRSMNWKNRTSAGLSEIDDQLDADEEDEYSDENEISARSYPVDQQQQQQQQQLLLQQLLLSRALLSGSVPDEENMYAQALLQLQQQQQQPQQHRSQPSIGKDRPYVCDVPRCDKRYTKHSHLVRHKVETHKMQKPEPRSQNQHTVSSINLSIQPQPQQPVRPASQLSAPSLPQSQSSPASGVVHHHPPPPNLNLNDRPYVCDFPGCRWSFKRQYHLGQLISS